MKTTTFKDNDSREWSLLVDGHVLSRARRLGNVDIGQVFKSVQGGGIPDIGQVVDLCFYAAEHNSQIQAARFDRESFLRLLRGKCMMPAVYATIHALAECFGLEFKEDETADPPKGSESNSAGPSGSDSPPSPE